MKYLLISILLWSAPALAYFQQELMQKKIANREATRWTLAGYLAQQERISLMDQWLALNQSANIFEMTVGGAYGRTHHRFPDLGLDKTFDDAEGNLDLYIYLFGLHGRYESMQGSLKRTSAWASLRLLGTSSQTTSLSAGYGEMWWHDVDFAQDWQLPFWNADLQLYISRHFGLRGEYVGYFSKTSNQGKKLGGHETRARIFWDLSVFRIFAGYQWQSYTLDSGGNSYSRSRDGWQSGLELFF